MYPPLPLLNRKCTKDWNVPNTDIIIAKGTPVFIPALALQRDPKFYPEPNNFKPERFHPDNMANTNFLDRPYMPFGEGPRICIGLRFGKIQSKTGLIIMIKNYNFQLSGNTLKPLRMDAKSFFMTPMGGLQMKITKRK